MANEEQLAILKQGVDVWNKWRNDNHQVLVDLLGADLRVANLAGAYFAGANLREADFTGAYLASSNFNSASLVRANLQKAILKDTRLWSADFTGANLSRADLEHADLTNAVLIEANLRGANLELANLTGTSLRNTDLRGAYLFGTNFAQAEIEGANLTDSQTAYTIFGNIDLSSSSGLESIMHHAPSTISTDTMRKSKGRLSIRFLRGCGLSDWEIEEVKLYNRDLSNEDINQILYSIYDLRASQALQISPLFISYSHADSEFVHKICNRMDKKGIRYWRDIHKATAGPLEEQVNRAIRQNPTVLVVLSKNSIPSDWVQHEVRTARETGKDLGRHVLCPVALDDSWKSSPWPQRVMEQIMEYNILDFSNWQDDSKFDAMFRRLIDGLELFYKGSDTEP